MKCPKCGYLGFDSVERCRNCGYDFSLVEPQDRAAEHPGRSRPTPGALAGPSLRDPRVARGARYRGSPSEESHAAGVERPLATPAEGEALDLPLFGPGLLPVARAPLAVRRPTPASARSRPRADTPRPVELELDLEAPPPAAPPAPAPVPDPPSPVRPSTHEPGAIVAPVGRRVGAALIDLILVAGADAIVLSFTLRLCGLEPAESGVLPVVPLALFYAILNGGYLILFTGTLGQTLGKMAVGIQVVPDGFEQMDLGRAVIRAAATVLSVLPLGLGLLPAAFGDHRALHDRLSRTRVIQIAAA